MTKRIREAAFAGWVGPVFLLIVLATAETGDAGFRNDESTLMRESRGHLRRDEMPSGGWGWIDIHRLTIAGTDRTQDLMYGASHIL